MFGLSQDVPIARLSFISCTSVIAGRTTNSIFFIFTLVLLKDKQKNMNSGNRPTENKPQIVDLEFFYEFFFYSFPTVRPTFFHKKGPETKDQLRSPLA